MKKLLLFLPLISSGLIKCITNSNGDERRDYREHCGESLSPTNNCVDPFFCAYEDDGYLCTCPNETTAVTALGSHTGCKPDIEAGGARWGEDCGISQSCANPYTCYGGDQVFENGGQCWCDDDSCMDHASGACVPCSLLPKTLSATATTEAGKKKYLIPYKGPKPTPTASGK